MFLLMVLPLVAGAFDPGVAGEEDRSHLAEVQLVHARELLGAGSMGLARPGSRDLQRVQEFVHEYARRSLKGEWKEQADLIARAVLDTSARHGFDPLLLLAVIKNESGFRPTVVGAHGEIGLMQLKPDTAEWIAKKAGMHWAGKDSLADPETNIRIGSAYLAMLRSKFGANRELYLAAYNMGVGNLLRVLKAKIKPAIYLDKTIHHYSEIYAEFLDQGKQAPLEGAGLAAI